MYFNCTSANHGQSTRAPRIVIVDVHGRRINKDDVSMYHLVTAVWS